MKQLIKKVSTASIGLTLALTNVAGVGATAMSHPSSASDPGRYIAALHPLNKSGVTGFANLSLNSQQPGATLTASINARGTEPNQIHAIHIHGMLDDRDAECPDITADVNRDKIVSVFEGAPFYGPIKVNFTDPITPFGPPANTTLFAPFAGAPTLANFPHADSSGRISYSKTIPFDLNNQYAVQALDSLTPLTDQHIVVHGGFAPESVDTPGGDPNKTVYDPLLPVACGSIVQTHRGSMMKENKNHQNDNNDKPGSINNTGPGSNNNVTEANRSSTTITNNNDVRASFRTNQNSVSGTASVNNNTNSGIATSGNASNNASNSVMVRLMNSGLFRK